MIMKKLFTSTPFVTLLITIFLTLGGILGFLLKDIPESQNTGLTYGFIAFSILPITLCLWGVKEFNAVFPSIARNLNKIERKRLTDLIDNRITIIIYLAFFIVLLQIFFAFSFLYIPHDNNLEFVILGILFGGILSSLTYGLYVCFSVRKIAKTADDILSTNIAEERFNHYKDTLK